MSGRRLALVLLSFGTMLGVSVYVVWSQWARGSNLPSIPLATHAIALALTAFEILARGFKIVFSARAVSIRLSLRTALRVCLAGDLVASLTPGRSGAEPARFLVLAEARLATPKIIVVLFLELAMGLLAFIALAFTLWFLLAESSATLRVLVGVIAGYSVFVLGFGALGYALSQRQATGPAPRWIRALGMHSGHWRRIQLAMRQLRLSVDALRSARPSLLFASFGVSVLHVMARLMILPVLVWSIDTSVALAPLILWPLVFLYGSAVAPAPGGGGAVELTFTTSLDGVLTPALLATSLVWWRFYTYYLYIIVGALGAGSVATRFLRGDRQQEDHDEAESTSAR